MGIGFSNESKSRNIRILILGIQSSGKSTFSKQMKILHCDGFRKEELNNYRITLTQDLFLGMREIISFVGEKLLRSNRKFAKIMMKANPYDTKIDDRTASCLEHLWGDKAVQEFVQDSCCVDSVEYLEIIKYIMKTGFERLRKEDFVPTNRDILHARQRTAGISETKFRKDKYDWNLIDVGGQRVERRKWVNLKRNLTAIIFIASLTDYDVISEDNPRKTRMQESIEVWEEVLQGRYVRNIPIILFFNKIDLFKKKIKHCHINKIYKNYKGGTDVERGQKFVMNAYLKKLKDNVQIDANNVKHHFICALDTENIQIVFTDIKNHIVKQRLEKSGI